MSETEIDAIENPEVWETVFDDKARAALHLADAMSNESWDIAGDLIEELRAQFSEPELAELVLVCGQANFNNRAGNAAKQLLG